MFHVEHKFAEVPAVAAEVFKDRLPLAIEYWRSLESEGQKRGMIGPREVPKLWNRHLLNCAVVQELIPDGAIVVDIGSGAGLPGIPLAIARPDITVIMVETMLRRTTYLTEFAEQTGLNVRIVRGRAEDKAVRADVGVCDVVTSRAVAALPLLMDLSMPFLHPGGMMLALKGSTAADEIAAAQQSARRNGARDLEVLECGAALLEETTTVVRAIRDANASVRSKRTRG